MKRSNISKFVGTGVLALSLAVLPATLSVSAQDAAPNNAAPTSPQDMQNNNAPNVDTTPFQETKGKADNFGWLGLIGLLGLLNLLRKPEEPVAYRDPGVAAGRTGDRY